MAGPEGARVEDLFGRRGQDLRVSRVDYNNLHCFWQLSLAARGVEVVGSLDARSGASLSRFLFGRITSLDRARHMIGRHCPRDPEQRTRRRRSVVVLYCLSACLRYPRGRFALRKLRPLTRSFSSSLSVSVCPFYSYSSRICRLFSPTFCSHWSLMRILHVSPNDSIKPSRLNAIITNSPRTEMNSSHSSQSLNNKWTTSFCSGMRDMQSETLVLHITFPNLSFNLVHLHFPVSSNSSLIFEDYVSLLHRIFQFYFYL